MYSAMTLMISIAVLALSIAIASGAALSVLSVLLRVMVRGLSQEDLRYRRRQHGAAALLRPHAAHPAAPVLGFASVAVIPSVMDRGPVTVGQ